MIESKDQEMINTSTNVDQPVKKMPVHVEHNLINFFTSGDESLHANAIKDILMAVYKVYGTSAIHSLMTKIPDLINAHMVAEYETMSLLN